MNKFISLVVHILETGCSLLVLLTLSYALLYLNIYCSSAQIMLRKKAGIHGRLTVTLCFHSPTVLGAGLSFGECSFRIMIHYL